MGATSPSPSLSAASSRTGSEGCTRCEADMSQDPLLAVVPSPFTLPYCFLRVSVSNPTSAMVLTLSVRGKGVTCAADVLVMPDCTVDACRLCCPAWKPSRRKWRLGCRGRTCTGLRRAAPPRPLSTFLVVAPQRLGSGAFEQTAVGQATDGSRSTTGDGWPRYFQTWTDVQSTIADGWLLCSVALPLHSVEVFNTKASPEGRGYHAVQAGGASPSCAVHILSLPLALMCASGLDQ